MHSLISALCFYLLWHDERALARRTGLDMSWFETSTTQSNIKTYGFAALFYVATWVYLLKEPTPAGFTSRLLYWTVFALHLINSIVLSCYHTANFCFQNEDPSHRMCEPSMIMFQGGFSLTDNVLFFLYLFIGDFIYPSGALTFCTLFKVGTALAFHYLFLDRTADIVLMFAVSVATNFAHIMVCREVVLRVHNGDMGDLREGEDPNDESLRAFHQEPRAELATVDAYVAVNMDLQFILGALWTRFTSIMQPAPQVQPEEKKESKDDKKDK